MSINEAQRRDLFNDLESAIGDTAATTLMQLLPYQPADQLVTRTDIHAQTLMFRGEMSELRADLRGEMSELRAELRGEMSELRAELRGEMSELRAEMRTDMADLKISMQRWLGGAAAANFVAVIAALVT